MIIKQRNRKAGGLVQGYHSDSLDRLFDGILLLRTREECRAFFEDVCTIQEMRNLAQRLEAASLLERGVHYQEIAGAVGTSTATISRVSRCLQYGSGGYRTVLERLREQEETSCAETSGS